jgi:hypothetical protein
MKIIAIANPRTRFGDLEAMSIQVQALIQILLRWWDQDAEKSRHLKLHFLVSM